MEEDGPSNEEETTLATAAQLTHARSVSPPFSSHRPQSRPFSEGGGLRGAEHRRVRFEVRNRLPPPRLWKRDSGLQRAHTSRFPFCPKTENDAQHDGAIEDDEYGITELEQLLQRYLWFQSVPETWDSWRDGEGRRS